MTMRSFYFAELNDEQFDCWHELDGSPFDVIGAGMVEIDARQRDSFHANAEEHLRDCHWLDWGSWAWWGEKCDFERFCDASGLDASALGSMHDGCKYAFVEMEWY